MFIKKNKLLIILVVVLITIMILLYITILNFNNHIEKPKDKINIYKNDIKEAEAFLYSYTWSKKEKESFIEIGHPNWSENKARAIVDYLKGKKSVDILLEDKVSLDLGDFEDDIFDESDFAIIVSIDNNYNIVKNERVNLDLKQKRINIDVFDLKKNNSYSYEIYIYSSIRGNACYRFRLNIHG